MVPIPIDPPPGNALFRNLAIVFTLSLPHIFTFGMVGPYVTLHVNHRFNTTAIVSGGMMGSANLAIIIVAALSAFLLPGIGLKRFILLGIIVHGLAAICLGVTGSIDGDHSLILMFFACVLYGVGFAIAVNGRYNVLLSLYPDRVQTVFGVCEAADSFGIALAPPLGGFSIEWITFQWTFVILGVAMLLTALPSACMLNRASFRIQPTAIATAKENSELAGNACIQSTSSNISKILRLSVHCFSLAIHSMAFLFMDTIFTLKLRSYGLTTQKIGLVYMTGPLLYAITAPIWGHASTKWPHHIHLFMPFGSFVAAISFLVMGPSPLVSFLLGFEVDPHLCVDVIGFAIFGLSYAPFMVNIGAEIMSSLQAFSWSHGTSRDEERQSSSRVPCIESLKIHCQAVALFTTMFHLGGFVGPVLGGAIQSNYGYPCAFTLLSCAILFGVSCQLIIWIWESKCSVRSVHMNNDEESRPLLQR